jgi:hypothetical protein
VGFGCSVAFHSALYSKFFDFLCLFPCFWLLRLFLMCFPSLAFAVSFSVSDALSVFLHVASFWHIVCLLSLQLSVHFRCCSDHLIPWLQSFFLRFFVLSAKKINFHYFALFRHCRIRVDQPHKIWN